MEILRLKRISCEQSLGRYGTWDILIIRRTLSFPTKSTKFVNTIICMINKEIFSVWSVFIVMCDAWAIKKAGIVGNVISEIIHISISLYNIMQHVKPEIGSLQPQILAGLQQFFIPEILYSVLQMPNSILTPVLS